MSGILYPNSLGLATLEDAAYYLEEKYHKDSGGEDSGAGDVLIVHVDGNGRLDKTWQEIVDAGFAIFYSNEDTYIPLTLYGQESNSYYVVFSLASFVADSPDGYPAPVDNA